MPLQLMPSVCSSWFLKRHELWGCCELCALPEMAPQRCRSPQPLQANTLRQRQCLTLGGWCGGWGSSTRTHTWLHQAVPTYSRARPKNRQCQQAVTKTWQIKAWQESTAKIPMLTQSTYEQYRRDIAFDETNPWHTCSQNQGKMSGQNFLLWVKSKVFYLMPKTHKAIVITGGNLLIELRNSLPPKLSWMGWKAHLKSRSTKASVE